MERSSCNVAKDILRSQDKGTHMIDNIEVNTQNSIRIASREGVIYIDPLEIPDKEIPDKERTPIRRRLKLSATRTTEHWPILYIRNRLILGKTSNRTVSTAVSARTIAIQPDTVEDLGVNGIGNGLFRKYDIMI